MTIPRFHPREGPAAASVAPTADWRPAAAPYRRLLEAGVYIHEWSGSVLHAKVATVDGRRLLVGSFNLDSFSLANLEALVEVADPKVVEHSAAS